MDLRWEPADRLNIEFAYDLSPRIQDPALFAGVQILRFGIRSNAYRAKDLDTRLYPDEHDPVSSFAVRHNLDRLNLSIALPWADVYLGRQAIAWGSAHAISPIDVIAPFAYDELDVEDRRGVDAVRVRVPISFMGEIDAGYVFGENFAYEMSAWFLRGRYYIWQTDFSGIVSGFRNNWLVGVDMTRAIGGAGTWLEAGYVFVDALTDEKGFGGDYVRFSVGADYSLRDGTYLFCEYHFNGPGSSEVDEYFQLGREAAYSEGAVYLLGQHYLVPGLSYQITPLLTLQLETLANLSDQSALLAPRLEYNIAQNIYLAGGGYLGLGDGPHLTIAEEMTQLLAGSEFGSYPDLLFTSFRIYF
jgi:hypothetical protein